MRDFFRYVKGKIKIRFKQPNLKIEYGWFSGDPFRLINITIGEMILDVFTIFSIQIFKFQISILIEEEAENND